MNNLNNFQNYVIGLKKSGLDKNTMIDYICGIFSNMATRNDYLAFCLKYINPKDPKKIIDEAGFRRMLRMSDDQVIRELFYLTQERYLHISRYRDDEVDQTDKTLSQIEKAKKLKELKKENFDSNILTNTKEISANLVNKLSDIEVQLKDLIKTDQIKLNKDQIEAIAKLETIDKFSFCIELIPIFETLKTISDNKLKLLIVGANMYLGKLITESK